MITRLLLPFVALLTQFAASAEVQGTPVTILTTTSIATEDVTGYANSSVLPYQISVAVLATVILALIILVLYLKRRQLYDIASKIFPQNSAPSILQLSHTSPASLVNPEDSLMLTTLIRDNFELSLPGFLQFEFDKAFRQVKKIAHGGGSTVYLGDALIPELQKYGAKLVIKVIGSKQHQKLAKLPELVRGSFKQEVSIMYFFREEKHIAKLLGWSDDPACIIMKAYTKGSLEKWISKPRMSSKRQAMDFMRDIARGIRVMHQSGFVHCDIKGQNILIDVDTYGTLFCVLTDFGITRIVDNTSLLVKDFQVINMRGLSSAYAAPEALWRFRRKVKQESVPGEVLMKVDQYSFAIIMIELLLKRLKPWDLDID